MSQRWMGPARSNVSGSDFQHLVLEELQKRAGSKSEIQDTEDRIKAELHERRKQLMPSQLEFLEDPAPRKAAVCTRRSGKTFVCRHILTEAVINSPWTDLNRQQPIIQYIAPTRAKALDYMWTPFKQLCEQVGLEAHWDDHQLRATFVNGCLVRMGGADDRAELEKYRGDAYRLVIIDESATMGPRIENLVIEIILPALMDYQAPLLMVGTPGEAQAGYFWRIFSKELKGWSVHTWSYMTNVHMPAETRTIEYVENETGLPWSDPKIQREWNAKWVADTNSLVYRFAPSKNLFDGPPPVGHDWRYLLGMDLGWHDPTAFVIGAYAKTHPTLHIVHSESHSHMLPSEIAQHVQELIQKYGRFWRIVCDTGGSMARSNVEEWNRRYNFGIVGAIKKEKYEYIEHANSELVQGRIKFRADTTASLQAEIKTLVWEAQDADWKRTDYRRLEHPGFPNHNLDAFLYLFKESYHYRSKAPEPEPVPGTVDYLNKQQLDAKLKAMRGNDGRNKFAYARLQNYTR